MKEQSISSATDLKAEFNRLKQEREESWRASGNLDVIESLSKALHELQNAGIDVRLQLDTAYPEEVWGLMKKVVKAERTTVGLSGILSIGHEEHLIALCVKEEISVRKGDLLQKQDNEVMKLCIANRSYVSKKLTSDFRGECFDLKEDPEAIQNLQKYIVNQAVSNEIIASHDIYDSFQNRGTSLYGKGLKSPVKAVKPLRLDNK
jgi:hypothetical protein